MRIESRRQRAIFRAERKTLFKNAQTRIHDDGIKAGYSNVKYNTANSVAACSEHSGELFDTKLFRSKWMKNFRFEDSQPLWRILKGRPDPNTP
jgi:hypothetical protein